MQLTTELGIENQRRLSKSEGLMRLANAYSQGITRAKRDRRRCGLNSTPASLSHGTNHSGTHVPVFPRP